MNKKEVALILTLTAISFIFRVTNLNYPKSYYFDESYTAFTASMLAKGNSKTLWIPVNQPINPPLGYEWQHPPLTRTIIAAATILLGDQSWVWRLPSVIAGTLTVPLVFLIAMRYFQNQKIGILAAFFLAFDGLNVAQSRIATRDALLVFLILTSLYLALRKKHALSATVAGLALATKWSAILLIPLILINSYRLKYSRLQQLKHLALFITISLIVYVSTYAPYFSLGFTFTEFIKLQQAIVTHMSNHAFTLEKIHPYHAPWWQWPFGFKPIAHYLDGPRQLWAMPNFLVFWFGTGALGMTTAKLTIKKWEVDKKTSNALLALIAGFLVFWLPWGIIHLLNRQSSASYLHYYLPSLPFLHILLAFWLTKAIESNNSAARVFAYSAVLSTFLVFLAIYPGLVGL